MQKTISGIALILVLFISSLLCLFCIPLVQSQSASQIFITAAGNVEGTDKIEKVGATYKLTDNIQGTIVVERNDILIDGEGFLLQGNGNGTGILLSNIQNVTLQNLQIESFSFGLLLHSASENVVRSNSVVNNRYGIYVNYSSNNLLQNNLMTDNDYNFWVEADMPSRNSFINEIDSSNRVDGKPIYYWVNQQDKTVPLDAGYVGLVNCTNITVQNLTLTSNGQGILMTSTTNSIITMNSITGNVRGIRFFSSSNNIISDNSISENRGSGIGLDDSSNSNIIFGNIVTANGRYGIWLFLHSNFNNVSGNYISKNLYGLLLPLFSDFNNIYENEIVNNDLGVWFESSSNNTLCGNEIRDNGDGIWLYSSSNFNSINENNITDSQYGLFLFNSSNYNNIFGNNITENELGVWLDSSSDNMFFHNNFDNDQQIMSENSINIWDDGYPSGGNYWSDYASKYPNSTEVDGSGIAETPYSIDENNQDRYPLINQWIAGSGQSDFSWPLAIAVLIIAFVTVIGTLFLIRKRTRKEAERRNESGDLCTNQMCKA
jgi:parallel beta-helix repeat protein